MDTTFSIAIHILILITESDTPVSSRQIAQSVGINPSHVRKIAGFLREAGLIDSRQGVAGFRTKKSADEITLLDVHNAVYRRSDVRLFAIHQNPSDKCVVGRYIRPTLQDVFSSVSDEMRQALAKTTLTDIIAAMALRQQSDGMI